MHPRTANTTSRPTLDRWTIGNRSRIACCLLLSLAALSPVSGQQLQLESVSLTVGAESFRPALPSYGDFVARTREPALFAQSDRPDAVEDESGALFALAIEFAFRLGSSPHRFFGGFERATLDANLFSAAAVDTTSPDLLMLARNEYFGLAAGYAYTVGARRPFTASAGMQLRAMLPVSAKTIERRGVEDAESENTFFARKSVALGAFVPVSLGIRVMPAADLQFTWAPGITSVGLDGSRSIARQQRTSIALRFYLSKS